MSQDAPNNADRRREPRDPAAFAFWYEPAGGGLSRSGWMLDISEKGASFLAATTKAPRWGTRIRLKEMYSRDRLVRERTPTLPDTARVVRVEPPDGTTRRVAVQFDAQPPAELVPPGRGKFIPSEIHNWGKTKAPFLVPQSTPGQLPPFVEA